MGEGRGQAEATETHKQHLVLRGGYNKSFFIVWRQSPGPLLTVWVETTTPVCQSVTQSVRVNHSLGPFLLASPLPPPPPYFSFWGIKENCDRIRINKEISEHCIHTFSSKISLQLTFYNSRSRLKCRWSPAKRRWLPLLPFGLVVKCSARLVALRDTDSVIFSTEDEDNLFSTKRRKRKSKGAPKLTESFVTFGTMTVEAYHSQRCHGAKRWMSYWWLRPTLYVLFWLLWELSSLLLGLKESTNKILF